MVCSIYPNNDRTAVIKQHNIRTKKSKKKKEHKEGNVIFFKKDQRNSEFKK